MISAFQRKSRILPQAGENRKAAGKVRGGRSRDLNEGGFKELNGAWGVSLASNTEGKY